MVWLVINIILFVNHIRLCSCLVQPSVANTPIHILKVCSNLVWKQLILSPSDPFQISHKFQASACPLPDLGLGVCACCIDLGMDTSSGVLTYTWWQPMGKTYAPDIEITVCCLFLFSLSRSSAICRVFIFPVIQTLLLFKMMNSSS